MENSWSSSNTCNEENEDSDFVPEPAQRRRDKEHWTRSLRKMPTKQRRKRKYAMHCLNHVADTSTSSDPMSLLNTPAHVLEANSVKVYGYPCPSSTNSCCMQDEPAPLFAGFDKYKFFFNSVTVILAWYWLDVIHLKRLKFFEQLVDNIEACWYGGDCRSVFKGMDRYSAMLNLSTAFMFVYWYVQLWKKSRRNVARAAREIVDWTWSNEV